MSGRSARVHLSDAQALMGNEEGRPPQAIRCCLEDARGSELRVT